MLKFLGIYECISLPLKIDALALVHRSTKVIHLYEILIESMCRNLRMLESCLLKQIKPDVENSSIFLPEPFHFHLENCGHFITRFYAKGEGENSLGKEMLKNLIYST